MRNFLSIKWLTALPVALALVSGCGGGGSDEISVTTGSLSKAQFIARADSICRAARSQFIREYSAFSRKHQIPPSKAGQRKLLGEIVETTLVPNYEPRFEEIGALGAPSGDEEKVSEFLTAFKRRLDEIREKPTELGANPYPFKGVAKLASAYGLSGCANSFG
jgi:hypothetical protein